VITRVINARLDTVAGHPHGDPTAGRLLSAVHRRPARLRGRRHHRRAPALPGPRTAATGLIDAALAVGGKDNVTVVVAGIAGLR